MPTAPYRIQTERLVIRCWETGDAAAVKEAIDTSLDHLRPWLPWSSDREPQPLQEKRELMREYRRRFEAGEDFAYGILSGDEREVLGGCGLHMRQDDGLEIGYWVRASAAGRGIATEAAAALTRAGFGICRTPLMEIRVEPDNVPSRRIPVRLGYVEDARLRSRLPPRVPGGPRIDILVFSMLAEEFAGSAASTASAVFAAFDAAGSPLTPAV